MNKVKENQIIESVRKGDAKEFQSLFDNSNFDIDYQFKDGQTLLHIASEKGGKDIISTLLENGADMEVKQDHFGYTPFHIAAINGNLDAMKIMLKYGIDINITDNYDRTAKELLIENFKHPLIVSWLCSYGSDIPSNIKAPPIQNSVIIEKKINDIGDNDENKDVILHVEGKEVILKKKMLSKHSIVLDNMINENNNHHSFSLLNTDFNSLQNVIEWMYTDQLSCNEIDNLIRTWYLSDIIKIRPLSRYIQKNKIIPELRRMASLSNMNDIDTILHLYDKTFEFSHSRYVKRFCASIILENLHKFRQHERFKSQTIEEFAEIIEMLYNDIKNLQSPSIHHSTDDSLIIDNDNNNIKMNPSLSTIGSMVKYIKNMFNRNYIPIEDILLKLPREQADKTDIPVSWRTYKMFKKEGTLTFYKNYLIYGNENQSYAIDYQNICHIKIQLKNNCFTIKEKNNKNVYNFGTSEIDRVYDVAISKFGSIVHFK